jgi:hypothetical protein
MRRAVVSKRCHKSVWLDGGAPNCVKNQDETSCRRRGTDVRSQQNCLRVISRCLVTRSLCYYLLEGQRTVSHDLSHMTHVRGQ